jgi:hypothetical protein
MEPSFDSLGQVVPYLPVLATKPNIFSMKMLKRCRDVIANVASSLITRYYLHSLFKKQKFKRFRQSEFLVEVLEMYVKFNTALVDGDTLVMRSLCTPGLLSKMDVSAVLLLIQHSHSDAP